MAGSELLDTVKEFLFPDKFVRRAIRPLDSALTPNNALDELAGRVIENLDEPDDVVITADGDVLVSSGTEIRRFAGENADAIVLAVLPGPVGPLCLEADGRLLVGVAGKGLMAVTPSGEIELVCGEAEGQALHCPTDIACGPDGAIYVTDGSATHHGDAWVNDLMEHGASGRLIWIAPGDGKASVLRKGMRWPSGVTVSLDGSQLVVCEAWAHNIISLSPDGSGAEIMQDNLPGYPGRISTDTDGSYLLAMFALRTQLVDFVLTQPDFVQEMMSTIEPDFWIRPTLRSLDSGLEPLQGGQIRKLGVIKPWAPPRSYGLCVRLDSTGRPIASMHSRAGGSRHGVTAVRGFGEQLAIAVRGGRQILVSSAKEF